MIALAGSSAASASDRPTPSPAQGGVLAAPAPEPIRPGEFAKLLAADWEVEAPEDLDLRRAAPLEAGTNDDEEETDSGPAPVSLGLDLGRPPPALAIFGTAGVAGETDGAPEGSPRPRLERELRWSAAAVGPLDERPPEARGDPEPAAAALEGAPDTPRRPWPAAMAESGVDRSSTPDALPAPSHVEEGASPWARSVGLEGPSSKPEDDGAIASAPRPQPSGGPGAAREAPTANERHDEGRVLGLDPFGECGEPDEPTAREPRPAPGAPWTVAAPTTVLERLPTAAPVTGSGSGAPVEGPPERVELSLGQGEAAVDVRVEEHEAKIRLVAEVSSAPLGRELMLAADELRAALRRSGLELVEFSLALRGSPAGEARPGGRPASSRGRRGKSEGEPPTRSSRPTRVLA